MKFWKCYGLLVLSLHNQVFVITDFFCTNATLLLRNESKELAKKRNDFWSQWGKNENVLEACVAIPASSFYLIMTIGLASSVPLNRFTSSERMSLFLFKTTECWAMIFVRVWLTWLLLHSAVSAAYSNTTPYNLGGPRPQRPLFAVPCTAFLICLLGCIITWPCMAVSHTVFTQSISSVFQ